MKALSRRALAAATATALGVPLLSWSPAQAADPVVINLIGINDFHGRIDANAVKFAGTVEDLRDETPDGNALVVSAGDNVSASLFASAVQGDIPTIDMLNALDLSASAVGNHELDKGADDLTGRLSDAADFPFLAANILKADDSRLVDPYEIFTIDGLKVAVVGAVTEEVPSLVSPGGIEGLSFEDPTDAINDTVADLEATEQPDVIVATIHDGAPDGTKTLQQNLDASPVFKKAVEQIDPAVDAIFMGHTHQAYAYDAPVPGQPGKTRPVLQTGQYGTNVGQIKLTVDSATGDVQTYTLKNQARLTTDDATLVGEYPRVAAVKTVVDSALKYADQVGKEPIGEQTADIMRALKSDGTDDRSAESPMGSLVADALLAKVKETPAGADIGITNPGGLRESLKYAGTTGTNEDGVITYAEANAVLPFVNQLASASITGTSLKKVLEQQWQRNPQGQIPSDRPYLQLGVSKNVRYTYDDSRPEGDRITSVLIDGAPLDPTRTYKVAIPSFLATGGDNFRAFTEGTWVDTGLVDYEAWIDYLRDNSPISPDFAKRGAKVTGVKPVYAAGSEVSVTLGRLDMTEASGPANTSISGKLVWGDGESKSLGTKSVTGGVAKPFTFTLPADRVGRMTIEAKAYPTGTTVTVPLQVKQAATIEAPAASGTYGDDVAYEVTLTGDGTPSGTVTLTSGDTVLGESEVSGGTASFTIDTTELGAGEAPLSVSYEGDDDFAPAMGSATLTVAKAGTTTSAPAPDPVAISDDAAITATVESATGTEPTGTVTVSDGDTELGSQAVDDGAATVTTDVSGLTIGSHTLTVAYSGDDDHEASTSTVVVKVFKGTTPIDATAASSPYGTSAVVEVTGDPGASGLVYVGEGDTIVGVGFLRDGVARVLLDQTLAVGSHELDVFYGGSATFDPAEGAVTVEVVKAATTTKLAKISPTKVVKAKTKATVDLTVRGTGFTVSGGTVTLTTGGKSYKGTVANGKVRVTLGTFPTSGRKSVKATYAGNGVALGSSTSFTVTVVKK